MASLQRVVSNQHGESVDVTAELSIQVDAGSNRAILLLVGGEGDGSASQAEVSSIVRDGQSFVRVTDGRVERPDWSWAEAWVLVAPNTGTATAVITITEGDNIAYAAYVLDGVNQSSPVRPVASASGSAASSSVTVSGVGASDFVVDVLAIDSTGHNPVPGANQTEDTERDVAGVEVAASQQAGADGGVMSWTWTTSAPFSHIAVAAIDASAVPLPSIEASAESADASAGTSHVVNLPAWTGGNVANDVGKLLMVILAKGSTAATINALTGWTELSDENVATGFFIAVREVDGTEGTTVTFTSSANTRCAAIAHRIIDAAALADQLPEIGTTATGSSTTPNPPSRAVTGGPKDVLAIAALSRGGEEADDDTWATAAPTNYGGLLQKAAGTVGTNLAGIVAVASRQITSTSSEDPATFTIATGAWRAQTIIVHGAATSATYQKAGVLSPATSTAGADVAERAELGALLAGARSFAADVREAAEAGSLLPSTTLAAADSFQASEAGTLAPSSLIAGPSTYEAAARGGSLIAGALLAAADVFEASEAGSLASASRAAAIDALELPAAGDLLAGAALSGPGSFEAAEAGALLAGALSAGDGRLEASEAGALIAGALASGAGFEEGGAQAKSGSLLSGALLAAAKAAEFLESGALSPATGIFAADAAIFSEAGALLAGTFPAGTEASEHHRSGLLAAAGLIAASSISGGADIPITGDYDLPSPEPRGSASSLDVGSFDPPSPEEVLV